jgi:hypothetical protein
MLKVLSTNGWLGRRLVAYEICSDVSAETRSVGSDHFKQAVKAFSFR